MDLNYIIESIVSTSPAISPNVDWAIIHSPIAKIAGRLLICSNLNLPSLLPNSLPGVSTAAAMNALLQICAHGENIPTPYPQLPDLNNCNRLRLKAIEGKKGQLQFLQSVLPQSMSFISHHLRMESCVWISCDTGKDMSVGVALAALQKFFDETGNLISEDSDRQPRTCLGVLRGDLLQSYY